MLCGNYFCIWHNKDEDDCILGWKMGSHPYEFTGSISESTEKCNSFKLRSHIGGKGEVVNGQ